MIDALVSSTTRNAISRLSTQSLEENAVAKGPSAPSGVQQGSFDTVLSDLANSVTSKLGSAEAISMKSMTSDVPTRDVVNAVMEAEQALQSAIAIRDKIVQAYLEISRIAI